MSREIEISGIFPLPGTEQLVGESALLSPVLQSDAAAGREQALRMRALPNQAIYASILETESILNKIFNTDNFSMMDSSVSETNESDPSAELYQKGLKSYNGVFGDDESSGVQGREAGGSGVGLSGTQKGDSYGELDRSSGEKNTRGVDEMVDFMDVGRNSNSADSERDSLDDYTTFDYGFDGSGIVSSIEDWESDGNSVDFQYDMAWPEGVLLEDGNEEADAQGMEGAPESLHQEGHPEGDGEAEGTETDDHEFEDYSKPTKEGNLTNNDSEFVGKEIEIGEINSIDGNDGLGRAERDVIRVVTRGPGSESSCNAGRGVMRVPSVEQEVVLDGAPREAVRTSSSSAKFRKWLSGGGSGGSRLQTYLGTFRENFKDNSVMSGSMALRGIFRRGGCLSGSSFNSSLVSSLGSIASRSDKAPLKSSRDDSSGGPHTTLLSGAQEARRSLRQRTLPMRISTKYQISNKTRKARENDVGSIWLIREIYLSLTPQILKLSMSVDGQWLILGSQDGSIRQWRFKEDDLANFGMLVSSASQMEPFFSEKEDLSVQAHSNAIISLHWENNERSHRFLSSSMDRTVKLWEAGCGEPAAVISCSDWPTSASFHPVQKNIIFVGSLDASVQILRLTPGEDSSRFQARVVETVRVQDLLTSLSISPNGKYLACGFKDGGVAFYDARTLKYRCDVDCRNRRGKSSKGRKVSGISWKRDNKSVLVTTNDSRVRLFNLSDLSTFVKFKGHINEETLLSAQISNDEKLIVSGSENGYICLWDLQQDYGRWSVLGIHCNQTAASSSSVAENQVSLRYDRINIRRGPTQHCVDSFKAFDSSLTSTILAPPAFSKKIIRFFKANHKSSLNYPSFGTYINEKNTHVFIAVNRNGQIRIFMNIPN